MIFFNIDKMSLLFRYLNKKNSYFDSLMLEKHYSNIDFIKLQNLHKSYLLKKYLILFKLNYNNYIKNIKKKNVNQIYISDIFKENLINYKFKKKQINTGLSTLVCDYFKNKYKI